MAWRSGADFLACDKDEWAAKLESQNAKDIQGGVFLGRFPWFPNTHHTGNKSNYQGSEDTEPALDYHGWGCVSSETASQESQIAEVIDDTKHSLETSKSQPSHTGHKVDTLKEKSFHNVAWDEFQRYDFVACVVCPLL